jgi:NitT/TauT family transport system ATP-binding protein
MKQRVAIARALAYDPEVLLMDEPFAAVDAQTRESLQEELLRIWQETGKTIIFITHSIDEALFLSDRVAVMSANPGTLLREIEVDIPRPRNSDRTSPRFGDLRHEIWELLQTSDKVEEEAVEWAAGQSAAAVAVGLSEKELQQIEVIQEAKRLLVAV